VEHWPVIQMSWELLDVVSADGGILPSFTDFITTPETSGPLYIRSDAYHTQITEYFLETRSGFSFQSPRRSRSQRLPGSSPWGSYFTSSSNWNDLLLTSIINFRFFTACTTWRHRLPTDYHRMARGQFQLDSWPALVWGFFIISRILDMRCVRFMQGSVTGLSFRTWI